MKLSDYVAQRIADHGITQVFMMTGGGAMHLNDSFGYEPRMKVLFNHHEQASAIAAEGYARVTGIPALLNVTTGPGGVNALTGVYGAWTDSIPMLIVSGQVKRETMMTSYDLPGLRQLGDQEIDIIRMAKGITKYSEVVMDPASIRYCLEKALHLATHGRQGPCWLDIPIDVQAAQINPGELASYDPGEDPPACDLEDVRECCREVLRRFRGAERPVILVGTGVRLAGAQKIFDTVVHKIGAPVAPAWTAIDQVASDDDLYCGRTGTIGDRAGNFAVQNADLVLVIGSRLNIRQVSYNWPSFARCAFKIQVDVDEAELKKPMVRPDLAVHSDAKVFLEELNRQIDACGHDKNRHAEWVAWCKARVARYPVVEARHRAVKGRLINPYHFIEQLFARLGPDDIVACGNATASVVTFQVARVVPGLRVFANSGCAAMGYDLPAAIGAAMGANGRRVVCLAGDGSIQLNVQELQTLAQHHLPVKIFVLNNDGYLSMRMSQGSFFRRFVGEGPRSGLSFPSMTALAAAYGIPAGTAEGEDFTAAVEKALASEGPFLCDVILDPDQPFEPKLSSRQLPDGRMVSSPLEDLHPFLPRHELLENLCIPPVDPQ
ncbi:MAG: acetolactate synthase [Acidobacteria bacterium]|nr:MAG: acetolactate synthase [Acidobacteriota bacterium]